MKISHVFLLSLFAMLIGCDSDGANDVLSLQIQSHEEVFDTFAKNIFANKVPRRADGYLGYVIPKEMRNDVHIAVVSNGVLFLQEPGMPDWSQGVLYYNVEEHHSQPRIDAIKPPTESKIVKLERVSGNWFWYLAE